MNQKTILILIVVLLIFAGAGSYFLKSKAPENLNDSSMPKNINQTESPAGIEKAGPAVTAPLPNSKITSPFVVKGSVPPGWMFEGVFPIKLLDANRKIIVQTQAKEVVSGTWNSGKNVEFSATLIFSTGEQPGFLVLEKDNPSGLEENTDSFEMPVNF